MLSQQITRVSSGLLAALVAATLLRFVFFDVGTLRTTADGTDTASLWTSLGVVLSYGLPPALLAVSLAEYVRIRSLTAHLALGIAVAIITAYLTTWGEALSSGAFSGGALAGLFLIVTGILSSLAYWAIAGRRAGWLGDNAEQAETMAAEAFRTASANARVEYCRECLAGAAALGLAVFVLFSWLSIEASGLRDWLVSESEGQGKSVLKSGGYAWASFKVEGDRGVVTGLAPDEVQKRAAFDSVRDALSSVTGFPGVLAQIENQVVARMPMASVAQQIAEANRRESEAKVAVEAARIAAESARAAEAEVRSKAEEQAVAAQAEIKRKFEEQARNAEAEARSKAEEQARVAQAEIKRKLEEQAKASELEIKRKLEEQAVAAEVEIKRRLEERARATEEDARKAAAATAAAAPAQPVEVAAVEQATTTEAKQSVTDVDETSPPAPDTPSVSASGSCTTQDLAIIESSRILFDMQLFDIIPSYEAELDRLASSARACAPRPIQVSGYAGSDGDSLFNRALGLQRAESVRLGLIARGVPATLVLAASGGISSTPDSYDAGHVQRALNRRTEFRLLEAAEISRDATLGPEERAVTCESELVEIMSQSIIHFPTASARISEESLGLVRKLAGAIEKCGSVIVTVEGHTDKIGGITYNQSLSESRANAVREALATSGVNPTRLAARGFASSRPYDPGETAEAYALNRRIEFKVSGKFSSTATGGP